MTASPRCTNCPITLNQTTTALERLLTSCPVVESVISKRRFASVVTFAVTIWSPLNPRTKCKWGYKYTRAPWIDMPSKNSSWTTWSVVMNTRGNLKQYSYDNNVLFIIIWLIGVSNRFAAWYFHYRRVHVITASRNFCITSRHDPTSPIYPHIGRSSTKNSKK